MVYALHKFIHFLLGKKFLLCRSHGFSVFGQQTTCVRKDNQMLIVIIRV
jgi:hypothetical protein